MNHLLEDLRLFESEHPLYGAPLWHGDAFEEFKADGLPGASEVVHEMEPEGQREWLARGVELHRKYALLIEWGTEVARMIDDLDGWLPTKNEVQLTLQTGPFATSLAKRAGLLLHLLAG